MSSDDITRIGESLISLSIIWYIIGAIIGFIIALICGFIAEHISNERNGIRGAFWLGFFLGIIGIIIAAFVSPHDSGTKKSDDDWICLNCNTRNSYNSRYCSHCGSSRNYDKTNTQITAPITGIFKYQNTKIIIEGNIFQIVSDEKIINEGTALIKDDKLFLIESLGKKRMTLSIINSDLLVALNGKAFIKIK